MKLSQLGEFGLIKNARDIFKSLNENIVVEIGDDCAAIKLRKGFLLIATTDALVEGIHFNLDYTKPYQLGIKSININLSDIAAMGGIPLYVLLSIAVPQNFSVKFINEFLMGVKEGAQRYKVSVIGGNVSSSKNEFSINITILGEVEKKYMLLRKGAKAGDKIFVTGYLGNSAAGMKILKSGQWQKKLIERHLMPSPRLTEGRFLAVRGLATSMIDISDGLASDIRRICEESNVGANIFIKNIPISRELKSEIRNPKSEINLALYGGEDYELLFTVKPENVRKLKSLWKNMKTPITMIGEITKRGINLVNTDGKAIPLTKEGYNHFKG
ncbi:MAG: thiamine-phosphate kinase [Nitrospinae bacterium RIFCSPLOWO2_12_39_16]|nr:MAG: thiamine-phosphate kinase [Nitrospinae bacterium RIFCSPLOWO2_02_39_17]OGW09055.1 MAG: thiamine-phosphate kinase [Nitrospinae bacterium RIFCSPLOWO2_12_39_16]